VGVIDSYTGGVEQFAVAPDGRAVAFSYLQRSCCTNDVRGWWRTPGGQWSAIDAVQSIFVGDGEEGNLSGGPNELTWFNDRFIAVGQRGAVLDVPDTARNTTWTSTDGDRWTSIESSALGYAGAGTASLDGATLVAPWNQDDGSVIVRSTTDGGSWRDVGTVGVAGSRGTDNSLSAFSLSSFARTDSSEAGYVMAGSTETFRAFWATSPDGTQWTVSVLDGPDGRLDASASTAIVFDGRLLVFGAGFTEGFADEGLEGGEPPEQAVVWDVTDNVTGAATTIEGCRGGFLDSITVDPSGRSIWAICSIADGEQEGDYVASTTQLVTSTDGVTFVPIDDVPAAWAVPTTEVTVGPIAITGQGVSVAVTEPGGDGERTVSVWTYPLG
jgi:hypothetical protein